MASVRDLERFDENEERTVLNEINQALKLLGAGSKAPPGVEVGILQRAQQLLHDACKHTERVVYAVNTLRRIIASNPRLSKEESKVKLAEIAFERNLRIAADNHLGAAISLAKEAKLHLVPKPVSEAIDLLNRLASQLRSMYAYQKRIASLLGVR